MMKGKGWGVNDKGFMMNDDRMRDGGRRGGGGREMY
jgi:hypothetical protein